MKTALITGINGQDGSYLAELLLQKGYKVHGIIRSAPDIDLSRLDSIRSQLTLHLSDSVLPDFFRHLLEKCQPDEIYNLAAHSFVPQSWNDPYLVTQSVGMSVLNWLEAIRQFNAKTRFFQASSSQMYGDIDQSPQNERSPFRPKNPYSTAKLFGHHLVGNYRDHFKLYAVSGILFNHESPRRKPEFVSKKITECVARIKMGQLDRLTLGNLDAEKDWGYAKDFVEAMWLMLQQPEPDDYVIGTGVCHSVREWVDLAFSKVGLDYKQYVFSDPTLWREKDNVPIKADYSKAREKLGWQPRTSFHELVHVMLDEDLRKLQKQPLLTR